MGGMQGSNQGDVNVPVIATGQQESSKGPEEGRVRFFSCWKQITLPADRRRSEREEAGAGETVRSQHIKKPSRAHSGST